MSLVSGCWWWMFCSHPDPVEFISARAGCDWSDLLWNVTKMKIFFVRYKQAARVNQQPSCLLQYVSVWLWCIKCPVVCSVCCFPAHTELLSLWQPSAFSFLTSIFFLSSFNNLASFFPSLFLPPDLNLFLSFSPCLSFFFILPEHLSKDRTSGSSCSWDKTLITLPLLGKPAQPDSSEVLSLLKFRTFLF